MSNCNKGYIKLYRSLLDSTEWQILPPAQKAAMIGIMVSVEWTTQNFACSRCKKILILKPGQTAKSINAMAALTAIPYKTMYKALKALQKTGFITAEKTSYQCHTIYTIKRWEKFQQDSNDISRKGNSSGNRSGNGLGNGLGKPYIYIRNKEIKKKTPRSYGLEAVANKWMDALSISTATRKTATPKWLEALTKLHTIDQLPIDDICTLVDYVIADKHPDNEKWKGWYYVCKSPMKLRKKNADMIPYHEIISQQMKNSKPKKQTKLRILHDETDL